MRHSLLRCWAHACGFALYSIEIKNPCSAGTKTFIHSPGPSLHLSWNSIIQYFRRLASRISTCTMPFDEERQDGGDSPSSCQRWSMKYLRLPRLSKMAVFLLLVVDLAIVGGLIYTLEPLITLLHRNEELFTPTVTLPLNGTASASYYSGDLDRQKIPRILHQTTKNSTIPDKWVKSQQSCKATYSDFEYKVSQAGRWKW